MNRLARKRLLNKKSSKKYREKQKLKEVQLLDDLKRLTMVKLIRCFLLYKFCLGKKKIGARSGKSQSDEQSLTRPNPCEIFFRPVKLAPQVLGYRFILIYSLLFITENAPTK